MSKVEKEFDNSFKKETKLPYPHVLHCLFQFKWREGVLLGALDWEERIFCGFLNTNFS